MQDVERPMKGVDRTHGAEIHPRRSFVDAVDRGVSVQRVEVEAGDVLWLEDVADPVKLPATRAMNLAVAERVLADGMNRTAAHEFEVPRVPGLQIRVGQRVDGGGVDACKQRPWPSGLEPEWRELESGRGHSEALLIRCGRRPFFGRESEIQNQQAGKQACSDAEHISS